MRKFVILVSIITSLILCTSCQVHNSCVLCSDNKLTKWESGDFQLYIDDAGNCGVLIYSVNGETLVFNATSIYGNNMIIYSRLDDKFEATPIAIYEPAVSLFEGVESYNSGIISDSQYEQVFDVDLSFECVDTYLSEDEIIYEWQPLSYAEQKALYDKAYESQYSKNKNPSKT